MLWKLLMPVELQKKMKEEDELDELPWGVINVEWKNYKMDRDGNKINSFAEKPDTQGELIENPYLQLKKPYFIYIPQGDKLQQVPLNEKNSSIVDLLVAENYLSITLEVTIGASKFIHKYSFLKKSALDEAGFSQRKWFKDDEEKLFGILDVSPLFAREASTYTKSEFLSSVRMIHFNTTKEKNNRD